MHTVGQKETLRKEKADRSVSLYFQAGSLEVVVGTDRHIAALGIGEVVEAELCIEVQVKQGGVDGDACAGSEVLGHVVQRDLSSEGEGYDDVGKVVGSADVEVVLVVGHRHRQGHSHRSGRP